MNSIEDIQNDEQMQLLMTMPKEGPYCQDCVLYKIQEDCVPFELTRNDSAKVMPKYREKYFHLHSCPYYFNQEDKSC